jgi:hypothetical protein
MGIDQQLGWWMAPDGNWYPPELRPDPATGLLEHGAVDPIGPLGPRSRFERLPLGGACTHCGSKIQPYEEGRNDPDMDTMLCAGCWPAVVATHPAGAGRSGNGGSARATTTAPRRTGTGGGHAAAAEHLMAIRLHRDLGERAIVLNHRRVPGRAVPIDIVVVASSGVWIVDARKTDGPIEYRTVTGGKGETRRLLIGGHDRTAMVDRVLGDVVPVAALVGDRSVPVHGAVTIVEGDWGRSTRLLNRRPHRHEGIWILWPAALINKIEEPGPLYAEQVRSIAADLGRALPAR